MDDARCGRLQVLLERYPLSEMAMVAFYSQRLPEGRMFLGNSLPIRWWDWVAQPSEDLKIYSHRGCNGIDGLVSGAVGLCEGNQPVHALLGDLSSLYDMAGLWSLQAGPQNFHLSILNNGGGKIFERIFRRPVFENSHRLNF